MATPFPARESRLGPLPEILSGAREEVDRWGGTLHLAYLPSYERYATIGSGPWSKDEVLSAAERAGIPVIDLDRVFAQTGAPTTMWTHPRGHLTPEGYRVVAAAIAEALSAVRQ